MTYQEVKSLLPPDAYLSSSFGYPGCDGYSEIWRTDAGRRWMLDHKFSHEDNGWTIKLID